jgi:MFS family permease
MSINRTYAARPYRTVWILTAAFSLSFLDRQLPAVLAQPIKNDLQISDTAIALLTGLAFSIFYTTFGVLMGWLADRLNRVRFIAVAISLWSLFTGASGSAVNMWQLMVARMGVGIGEAACNPASLSIISDLFPPEKRGLPMSLFMLGIPIGTTLGIGIGAWVAADLGWRWAFRVAALLGFVSSGVLVLLAREPLRGGSDIETEGVRETFLESLAEIARICRASPAILSTFSAVALASFVGFAILIWTPALLLRDKGMSLHEIALFFAPLSGFTAVLGLVGSGLLMNRFASDGRVFAIIPMTGFCLIAPLILAVAFSPSWPVALVYLSALFLFSATKDAPSVAVIHSVVPPERRAIATSLLSWINNGFGLVFGPLFVGWLSDMLEPALGIKSLPYAFAALAPIAIIAAIAYYVSLRAISSTRGKQSAPH